MAGVPLQQQKIDDDYELWDPRNREDTRKGKGFVYIGAALGIGAVGYMARNFKNRPAHIRPSVYLIHTRLLAQGLVVGLCSLGMFHQMYQRTIGKEKQS